MRLSSRKWTSLLAVGALGAAGIGVLGTPVALAALAAPLNDCASVDNGDPVLDSLTMSPTSVDVTGADAIVTISAEAHDTGTIDPLTTVEDPGSVSGVDHIDVTIDPPTGTRLDSSSVRLVESAGEFTGSLTVPRWSVPGDWSIQHLTVYDRAGNYTELSDADMPFAHVIHATSIADTTGPVLRHVSFSPSRVDTTARSRKVTFRVRATDTESGVRDDVALLVRRPGWGNQQVLLRHVSGNVYLGNLRVPRWVGDSTWRLRNVTLHDKQANMTHVRRKRLTALGFPRRLRVLSGDEEGRPRITGFSRTPALVDVRTSNGKVTLTVKARDSLSGVADVTVALRRPDVGTSVISRLRRVSGTAKDGTWRGTVRFERCATPAMVLHAELIIGDRAGNFREYAELRPGWPKTVTIAAADHIAPFAELTNSPPPPDGPVGIEFNEPVSGLDDHTAVVAPLTAQGTPGDSISGSWTCANSAGAVDCLEGPVSTASYTPTEALPDGDYVVQLDPEHYLGLTDLAGNPPRRSTTSPFTVTATP